MTLRRGRDWGEHRPLAAGAPVARDDAALVEAVDGLAGTDAATDTPPEVGLLGGDLHRTLGSPAGGEARLRSAEALRLPVDLGEAELTDAGGTTRTRRFCAHLVAVEGGGRLFGRRTVVVMNGTHLGDLDLGPRAHPGDGLLDVTDGRLPLWDRIRVGRRLRSGTHVPHPQLAQARVRSLEVRFGRPAEVSVDGVPCGRAVSMAVRCLPAAVTVVV